jgi:hypothetical protein
MGRGARGSVDGDAVPQPDGEDNQAKTTPWYEEVELVAPTLHGE